MDFSQYDLNGDGFTGGSTTERLIWTVPGSTQYGTSIYSTSACYRTSAGDVSFDENQLTDLKILCYYAYSPLYRGTDNAREALLAGRCSPVTVTVDPGSAIVPVGNNNNSVQQSTALGSQSYLDSQWQWKRSSPDGLLTAGKSGGTFTVRAISMPIPVHSAKPP